MPSCWCLDYHFCDLEGREICECRCHWDDDEALDQMTAWQMMAIAMMRMIVLWVASRAIRKRDALEK